MLFLDTIQQPKVVEESSTLNFTGSVIYGHNSAEYGGGISALKSILNLTGSSNFKSNTVKESGGGIYIRNSTLISAPVETVYIQTTQLGIVVVEESKHMSVL